MNEEINKVVSYLSIGSNLDDRLDNLLEAIRRINILENVEIKRISSVYETDPVGYQDQGKFLNMVIKVSVDSNITPAQFLKQLLEIEQKMGRVRRFKWGPRNIDIDILLFDTCSMDTDFLHLPHKEMFKRAFVIIPLKEIFNDWNLYRFSFDEIISELDDKDSVLLYKEIKD